VKIEPYTARDVEVQADQQRYSRPRIVLAKRAEIQRILFSVPMTARILVVDDSGFSRRILKQYLEEAGYSVDEAKDGMEALERYALGKPAVVLLDVVMDGMSGLEVLTKLRALDPGARVLLATADVQASTADLARDAGAVGILCKPFQKDRVIQTIHAAAKGEAAWS
jgi:two-component system chemotaxis response regulator CheY